MKIYSGDFDLEDLREDLERENFKENEHEGVEVWERESDYGRVDWVAVMDGNIAFGSESEVKSSIPADVGEENSFAEREDFKSLIRMGSALSCSWFIYPQPVLFIKPTTLKDTT